MNTLLSLEPKGIWAQFNEILQVPRPSKKEGKIIAWLEQFASKHSLKIKKDEAGNILIEKPASKGYENRKTIVLQSHMDMVCEKNADTVHDFEHDPIQVFIDGEWLKAKGTTLGADDGIGMAAALAILADNNLKHGALECLFTVDEETGLTGAFNLKSGFFSGKTLVNLDSEDDEEILIGCAGGMGTIARFSIQEVENKVYTHGVELKISGLNGGHSGDDINKGLANANKVLVRIIHAAFNKFDFRISYLDGGNLHNAIAREAKATLNILPKDAASFELFVNQVSTDIKKEYSFTESNLKIELLPASLSAKVYDADFQKKVIHALVVCPHGVHAMSRTIENLVETSTNLASVKTIQNELVIGTSQRSSYEPSKYDIADKVAIVFQMAGAQVSHNEGYPGWMPNTDSALLKISVEVFEELFKHKPQVKAIHAGLECGLFLEKYKELDMISIGPTMRGVHSPDERLNIASVAKFWAFLCKILEKA
jgi:dipeptidase D